MPPPAGNMQRLLGEWPGLRILDMTLMDEPSVRELMALARREDLGDGDLTTSLLSNGSERAVFHLLAKQACVFAGRDVGDAVGELYGVRIEWSPVANDGQLVTDVPVELGTLTGSLADILAAERVVLNFLQRLCGVATLTRTFVDAVAGTGAVILDTRKTIPGWRSLDKYAVRCGGGTNHRCGLFDAVLIKDNHLRGVPKQRLAGHVFDMLNRLGERSGTESRPERPSPLPLSLGGRGGAAEPAPLRVSPGRRGEFAKPAFVEVEAASLEEVEEILKVVGVDMILLDNFTVGDLRESVALRDGVGLQGKVLFEASGGVNLRTVRTIAETGVERISVGALTHSAPAIDLSLERVA